MESRFHTLAKRQAAARYEQRMGFDVDKKTNAVRSTSHSTMGGQRSPRWTAVLGQDLTLAVWRISAQKQQVRQRLGRDTPIEIHTIREAAPEEIDLWQWHHEMLRAEEEWTNDDNE